MKRPDDANKIARAGAWLTEQDCQSEKRLYYTESKRMVALVCACARVCKRRTKSIAAHEETGHVIR